MLITIWDKWIYHKKYNTLYIYKITYIPFRGFALPVSAVGSPTPLILKFWGDISVTIRFQFVHTEWCFHYTNIAIIKYFLKIGCLLSNRTISLSSKGIRAAFTPVGNKLNLVVHNGNAPSSINYQLMALLLS